ncbi:MAG: RecQ family ATP-dependent DNA helicase, partial [Bacteroidales bacterium]|nr:RecQ family ATP-dependent DNA helicase [Bacteroidales bacterium]
MTPKQVLTKYWGHAAFRPLQEEIVNSVLAGKDTLALLPTGGGKSICFQVPALLRPGVCLVVTPLIALMKDQAEGLKKRGVSASAVFSGMPLDEITRHLDNCLFGNTRFLYLSPERLGTDMMRDYIDRMQVSLLAVDEAHCISQWGYDFRPPYLEIARVRELIPGVPVIALTATATPEVVLDIQEKLEFREPNVFSMSFERKNLTYYVFREEDKLNRLLRILDKTPGSGIIYVRNRRHTREIDEFLRKNGYSSSHYHAGLLAAERNKRQEDWIKGRTRIIVSTNAFGMGIDKPDVRFVVHMDLPDSIEAYFQEAGRAGRDGKRSHAVLLFEESDLRNLRRFHETSFPPLDEVRRVYRLLGNYLGVPVGAGLDAAFDFDLASFCGQYGLARLVTHSAMQLLEREGYVVLSPV